MTITTSSAHSPSFQSLHLHHSSFSNPSLALPTSQLILQHFPRFTYITAHSPTLPLLYLHHSSFSNPSLALPMSQLILQPFPHFTYVTAHSPTLPSLYLCHSSFSNPSFACPTSQDFHLHHLASCSWKSIWADYNSLVSDCSLYPNVHRWDQFEDILCKFHVCDDTITMKPHRGCGLMVHIYSVILSLEAPNFCLYVGHLCEFCDETLCTHTLKYALLHLMLKMVPSLIRTRLYTPLQIPEHFY